MKYDISREVAKKLKKIKKSDPNLYKTVLAKIELFSDNEKHSSLRIHKLEGEMEGLWSLSVNKGIRMIYYVEEETVVFINIGTHDQVYRMN